MKGLELSFKFYEYAKNLIDEAFPDYADKIAAGLVGEGSDCFGYDDEISRDHDFEPRFCLWIRACDEDKIGFNLERLYAKLPKEFLGFKRSPVSPVGDPRHGVITVESFYTRFLGSPNAPSDSKHWLNIPQKFLACATNGKVFRDDCGYFSEIRNELLKGYPRDVRLKKLASHLLLMGQSGQYNYARCIDHGENGAAQLAVNEFVTNAISAIHLINNRYCPFYKWAYKSLRELPVLSEIEQPLIFLTENGNDKATASAKAEIIDDIAALIIKELQKQDLTDATCNNLETHTYSVNYKISDGEIRNLSVIN